MSNIKNDLLSYLVHDKLVSSIKNCIKKTYYEHNLRELYNIFSDYNRLNALLGYYGIGEKTLSSPVHRQELEKIAFMCLNTLIDTHFDIVDINYYGTAIKIEFGSPRFVTDSLTIDVKEDGSYRFVKISNFLKDKLDTKTIEINGSDNKIVEIISPRKRSIIKLNDSGFAIGQIYTSDGTNIHKLQFSKGYIIKDDDDTFKWNGNPLNLNSEEPSEDEIIKNVTSTIVQNPESLKYYVETLDEKTISNVLSELDRITH